MYVVAGTQAQHASQNYLSLMQLSDISQGRHGSNANNDSDDDMSDDEDKDRPPQIHTNKIAHHGSVNRLRCMPQQPTIVASWGDTGLVQVTLRNCLDCLLSLHYQELPAHSLLQLAD